MRTTTMLISKRRRGIAVLEFAMSFPLLALMIMFMIWMGGVFAAQARVSISVRNDAWRARHDEASSRPLQFSSPGTISRDATEEVTISLPMAGLPTPQAEHFVLGGAWDYRQLPLSGSPNWKEQALAAGSGSDIGSIQGIDGLGEGYLPDLLDPDALLEAFAGEITNKILEMNGLEDYYKRIYDWF